MGMDSTLHLPLPSMNMLSQTKLVWFPVKPLNAFFEGSWFLYFILSLGHDTFFLVLTLLRLQLFDTFQMQAIFIKCLNERQFRI
jgi:hypothetical protein